MMMDSNLVNYTRLSPHYTPMNDKKVRKITIHHMAGNLSVEACGNAFQGSREASSNYGIGSDGRVGLYVHEKDRAWTSSNRENDGQAITIEVANERLSPYWTVSAAAYEKLIQLCVDICKRYNITPYYDGTKNGTFTEHCMFKATTCPGPYLHSRMGAIAEEVKKRMNNVTVDIKKPVGDIVKDDNLVWNKLFKEIGNAYGTAALMGNLMAESHIYSNNLQNTFNTKLGMSDDDYTSDVDSGRYTNFINDGAGYGIAQWTFWSRKGALYEFAKSRGVSICNLEMQVDFLIKELNTTYSTVLFQLKTAYNLRIATEIVLKQFEKPANTSEFVVSERVKNAQDILAKHYHSNTMYRVQVGAYRMRQNAQNVLDNLKKLGYTDSFITVVNGLYKIQVGSYNSYENARKQLEKVKASGCKDAFIAEVTV